MTTDKNGKCNEHEENNSDYNKLQELLNESSRTFAFTLEKLPRPLSMWLGAAYLGARIIDEVEDSGLASIDKGHLLKRIPGVLRGATKEEITSLETMLEGVKKDKTKGYRMLLGNLGFVQTALGGFPSKVQDIIRTYYEQMTEGLSNPRIQNIITLEDHHNYCHYAAGVVGYMVTELTKEAGYFSEEQARTKLMPSPNNWNLGVNSAHDFGVALQLVNNIRDFYKDAEEGIYRYPQQLFEKSSTTYDSLLKLQEKDKEVLDNAYKEILRPQIEDAKKYIFSADKWIEELPFSPIELRQSWGDALAMSAATLRMVNTPRFFYDPACRKISKDEVNTIDSKIVALTQQRKGIYGFLEHLFEKTAATYNP